MLRYNKEYFGYIVGYQEGSIHLMREDAGPLLELGISSDEMQGFLLRELEIRPNFHLQTPLYVWLELTRRCNLNCPHCYINGGQSRENEMTTQDFIRLLEEMATMGVWAVTFTGGEPTLHPDFSILVNYARKLNFLIGIATNGMFLTEKLLNSLPRDGVIISISLDNLHTGIDRNMDFLVASRAVLRCQKMGFLTNIMTNTNKKSIAHLSKLIDWGKMRGVSIRSVPFSPIGRGKENPELENTIEDVEVAADFWLKEMEWEREYHEVSGLCVGTVFDYGETIGYMTRRCSSGRTLCYISADGTVYPCTMCAAENILSPGNVRERSFVEMWRSDWKIRHFNWDNFAQTCDGCVVNNSSYHCSQRCPALSHARNNELFGCGASDFQIVSTIVRTAMLERSPISKYQCYVGDEADSK